MKTILVMITLIIMGIVVYGIFLTQYDVSEIKISKIFGTITTTLGSPFLGSSQASITIIEFGNYQCDECKKWFQETKPHLITNYVDQGKINMIFVDTQLSKNIPYSSFASYCANDQERYWDYHNKLFQNNVENTIDIEHLKQFAIEIGLDEESFDECLDSKKYEKKVKYSTYEAKKNGINRLPTFIIIDSEGNFEKILGFQPLSTFEQKINSLQK